MIELPTLRQRIVWHTSGARAEGEALRRKLADVGKAFRRTEEATGRLDDALGAHRRHVVETRRDHDRLARGLSALGGSLAAFGGRFRTVRAAVRDLRSDASALRGPLSDLGSVAGKVADVLAGRGGRGGKGSLASAASEAGKAFRSLVSALKVPAIIVGVNALANLLSGLTAGVFGLVGSITPVTGLLGALPGLLGGVLAGVAGVGPAFFTAAGAVKALMEAAKGGPAAMRRLEEAMAGVGPATRGFAETVVSAVGRVRSALSAAGEGFFASFGDLRPLLDRLLPFARGVLGRLGALAGDLVGRGLRSLARPEVLADLSLGARASESVFVHFARAAGNVATALRHVMVAAVPLTEWIGRLAENMTKAWADRAAIGRSSGSLERFFASAAMRAQMVGRVVRDLFGGLNNMLKAGRVLGDSLWATMESGLRRWRDWTASLEGRRSLERWFADAEPAVREAFRLVKDLFGVFMDMTRQADSAGLLRAIRTDLVPILREVSRTVGGGFGRRIVETLASIGKVFALLAGETGPLNVIVRAVKGIVDAIGGLLERFGFLRQLVFLVTGMALALKGIRVAQFLGEWLFGFRGLATQARAAAGAVARLGAALAGLGAARGTRLAARVGESLIQASGASEATKAASAARTAGAATTGVGVAAAAAGAAIAALPLVIGAVAVGWSIWADRAAKAKQRTQELTQAISQSREEGRKLLAQRLVDKGLDRELRSRGIAMETFLRGVAGGRREFAELLRLMQERGASFGLVAATIDMRKEWAKAAEKADRLAKAHEAAEQATRKHGNAVEEFARKLRRQAEEAFSAAEDALRARQSASSAMAGVEQARRELDEARRRASESREEAARRAADAARAVADAEERLAEAQRRSREAQEALTKAREQAVEQLEQLELAAQGAGLSEVRARESLRRAREELARAALEGDADRVREASLSIAEAELAVREAVIRNREATEALNEARAKGIEGSDAVTSAQREAVAAAREERRAREDLDRSRLEASRARRDAALAEQEALRQVQAAELAYRDAAIAAADAAVEAADAERRAAGQAALTLQEKIEIKIAALRRFAQALAPGSEARRLLDEFVERLNAIKATYRVALMVESGQATKVLDSVMAAIQQSLQAMSPLLNLFMPFMAPIFNAMQATVTAIRQQLGNINQTGGGAAGGVRFQQEGGVLPRRLVGPGMVTTGARAVVGEGNPVWPEFVIPTDPAHRERALALFAALAERLDVTVDVARLERAVRRLHRVQVLASGGVVARGSTTTVDRRTTVENVQVVVTDPRSGAELGREIAWGLRTAGV